MNEIINPEQLGHKLSEGFSLIADLANWGFIATFILISAVFALYSTKRQIGLLKSGKKTKLNLFDKIPKGTKVLSFGILLAILFMWAYGLKSRVDVVAYIISIAFSMVIYDAAVRKIIEKITGLHKLEEEKKDLIKELK